MISVLVIAFWACGLVCGVLLFRRMPSVSKIEGCTSMSVSIIIPARNEEKNLPVILSSIKQSYVKPAELIVVDDDSSDNTAEVARSFEATVLRSKPKPQGWMGKPWACQQGAEASTSELLFFLDADTWLEPEGLPKLLSFYQSASQNTALSVLPYHVTNHPYEELSLFFNLLMAAGTGGFSGFDGPKLFGQSLLIDRHLYFRAGGHDAVRAEVLENLHFTPFVQAAGGRTRASVGRNVMAMRMFPDGFAQLCLSWKKGFATGATATAPLVLLLSVLWINGAVVVFLACIIGFGMPRPATLILYLICAGQLWLLSRRIGSFRFTTALLYPVPLIFYFAVFGSSVWSRRSGKSATWKGRHL